ncbi:MAG: M1 family metallopeptidase [Myxococcales bacterium]|nr:M1 family metallopeptidase [Myxococcales bacterium]
MSAATKKSHGGFRLSPTVRPSHYELHVELDPERSRRYRGTVEIRLSLGEPGHSIELHSADLKLSGARLLQQGATRRGAIQAHPERETAVVSFKRAFAAGEATLQLSFAGRLRDDLRGLYFARSGGHRYAFTQLEAADARRFFPCFDEPAFKARFSLQVTTAAELTVVSNAPSTRHLKLQDGRVRTAFATTPPLSTYLVALAVGKLSASRVKRAGRTPIRVYHVPGHEQRTAFARKVAAACLEQLERYFDVPYPYAKLDLLAVPDFEFGAMENAGAVFFREALLLVDEARIALPEKKRVVEVICHELAHMWYGNLVTMKWWDDLWLNEAFATWMAFEIGDRIWPELEMWTDFGQFRASALEADALRHTHAIYCEVRDAEEATENFDLITYEKGAAVVRMLERYLGPKVFQRGVRKYIARHREGNATADDLWRALSDVAGQGVAQVVRPWIEREGFPLLRINRRRGGGLELSQERFVARGPSVRGGGKAPKRLQNKPWPLPVVLRSGRGKKGRRAFLLDGPRTVLSATPKAALLYANADEGGFYRPLHEGKLLAELTENVTKLAPAERLGLLDHQWAHAHAGYDRLGAYLDLVLQLGDERDPAVLGTVVAPLAQILDQAASAPNQAEHLRGLIADCFAGALETMGPRPKRGEDPQQSLRRGQLLLLVGVVAEAPEVVATWAERGRAQLDNGGKLDANLALVAATLAAREGGPALQRRFLRASQNAPTPQEQRRYRMALAEFRDPRALELSQRACLGNAVPTQDRILLLSRMLQNPSARQGTWDFVREHWAQLRSKMPTLLMSRLVEATPALLSARHRREVKDFFTAHPLPTAMRALKQADERFVLDLAFARRGRQQLDQWLEARAGDAGEAS